LVLSCLLIAPGLAGGVRTLGIETGAGVHEFEVELAETANERAKGLMFRRVLGDDQGMLFDFGAEQGVSMWMRNTYISLDMLFAGADGVIHRIAARTEPFSEKAIDAGAPTRYVLELKAGTARRLAIAPGDRMLVAAE
jgi:hypothetical protein